MDVIRSRVTTLMANPAAGPYPVPLNVTQVRWVPDAPASWSSPGLLPKEPDVNVHTDVMRVPLRTPTHGRFPLSADAARWLHTNVPMTSDDVVEERTDIANQMLPLRRRAASNDAHLRINTERFQSSTHVEHTAVDVESDDGSEYEPPESLYEPPGSVDSAGSVSAAASDGLGASGS